MTDPYDDDPALTPEQRSVVEQPADALLLVTAGAGAGKTHTIVRRLERLISDEDLNARDVLVLSFSRSAVHQLRNRIVRTAGDGNFVRVQTFDSWALDLLMEVDANQDWSSRSFDERIRGATAAIVDGLADDRYEELCHVVIDEVQDLVDDRRNLVQVLLARFECGFTVVGDPAQSIYGFQVADPAERSGEANRFIEWLRAHFADLVELTLTENFRARTAEARTALAFGPGLRVAAEAGRSEGDGDYYEDLRTALMDTLILGDLNDGFVRDSLQGFAGTTAILCRTNGQALLVSESLHEAKVPHRLQRSAQDRVVPAWIGMLFDPHRGNMLTRDAFEDLVPELPLPKESEPSVLWSMLMRSAAGSGRRSLDLGRLRQAVATGRLPDELTAPPPADLIISSFHRAKGLEFDRVIVMDPGPLRGDTDTDEAEEARLLYVAMTRPLDELMHLATANTWNVRIDDRTKRWVCYGPQPWQRMGMEIVGSDVHSDDPAGTAEFSADPVELQHRLAATASPGDPVVLERRYEESLEVGLSPPYLVVHDGTPIGAASELFRKALYRLLQQNARFVPRRFPRLIEGVRVDAVETVTGSEAAGAVAGLGGRGVWLAPRLVGLGRFTYDRQKDGDG
ncbi:MAG: UvrD-helicase domain-containing protein [Pseudonocardiaceae bacterium]